MNFFKNKKRKILTSSVGIFLINMPLLSLAVQCSTNSSKSTDMKTIEINDKYFDTLSENFDKTYTITSFDPYNEEVKTTTQKDFWTHYKAVEGTVTRVTDGDTVKVTLNAEELQKAKELTNNLITDSAISLRIPFIDTPEAYTVDPFAASPKSPNEKSPEEIKQIFDEKEAEIARLKSEGNEEYKNKQAELDLLKEKLKINRIEKSLSELDTEFAKSLLLNKKVRMISSNWGDKSYNRNVAHIFYQDETTGKWKLFSLEVLKNGYSLPRLTDSEIKGYLSTKDSEDPKLINTLLLPYIANAFNYGYKKGLGFYSDKTFEILKEKFPNDINKKISSPDDLVKYYGEHGNIYSDAKEFFQLPGSSGFSELKSEDNYYKLNKINIKIS
ncbi:hypothetical protein [Mycoplasmopsis gallinacea]|uniref:TNase-like domain-containing protein n=1 Tax=Mycoplasmopsis gallinacea TaxID=29556 RepID=A0A6H0V1L0_9BACT|nr:hypothetical protein [Mycoplasmopsis gallinacea]QIW62221.1 hypothetical protein GOQ20_02095 [Mycoplasmopsis gallinacea]